LLSTTKQHNKSPYLAVIDDETDIVYLFKEALSKINGIKVFGFSDTSLALAHFQTNHESYRAVISDYKMEPMTGIELLGKMKDINPSVTRILISAFEIQDELDGDGEYVDKVLKKPISMIELINEVQKLVANNSNSK
jgi:response regulator RpfG family c-di-GMP phosphodiesterase